MTAGEAIALLRAADFVLQGAGVWRHEAGVSVTVQLPVAPELRAVVEAAIAASEAPPAQMAVSRISAAPKGVGPTNYGRVRRDPEVVAMIRAGILTDREIARHIGVSGHSVLMARRNLGLAPVQLPGPARHRMAVHRFGPDEVLAASFDAGRQVHASITAKKLGISEKPAYRLRKRYGIHRRLPMPRPDDSLRRTRGAVREPDPHLPDKIRASAHLSAEQIALIVGPDSSGAYYTARSISTIASALGIPLGRARKA